MSITNPSLSSITDDQRAAVESILIDFDLQWYSTRLLDSTLDETAKYEPELRKAVLAECIKIDLEKRWDEGDAIRLEWYLRELPMLGSRDDLPPDLIQAEFETRCRYERVRLEELRERFPVQSDQLEHLIAQQIELATPPDSDEQPEADPVPTPLGRYRIRRKLGDGGMGQVFLAWDTKLEREMAIKLPHANQSVELAERRQREAATAARLRHRNICPVYDVGVIDGRQFIAMAYIEGDTLAEKLKQQGPMKVDKAIRIAMDVASAVEHAHNHGVVHRDLKPSNIIIEPDGTPVVTDFGLAQMLDQPSITMTPANTPIGTPAYMAPEQIKGDRNAIGPKTDVYGLGTVLYEMLSGRVPFNGSYSEVLADAIRIAPVPPSKFRPDTPPRLERICLKALAKEPDDRFESAEAMSAALGPEVPTGNARRKSPGISLIATIVAVAVLVGTVGMVLQSQPDPRAQFPAMKFDRVVEVTNDDELTNALNRCISGTEIRLAPGKYTGRYIENLETQTHRTPLRITAADPKDPPIITSASGQNFGFMLARCEEIYLSHLVFDKVDQAIDVEDCLRIAVSNCTIRYPDVPSSDVTAIHFKRVEGGYVGDCRIVGWNEGTGIMVRNSLACVAANNRLEGSPDDNEEQDSFGVRVCDGSADCIVVCNEIIGFESSIQLGGYATNQGPRFASDFEASRIVVRDNYLAESTTAVWFASAADSIFEQNTILRPRFGLVRFVEEVADSEPCRNVVRNNIFVYDGFDASMIVSDTISCPLRMEVNHWCRTDELRRSVPYCDSVRFDDEQSEGVVQLGRDGIPAEPMEEFGRQVQRVTALPSAAPSTPDSSRAQLKHGARELAYSQPNED